MAPTPVKQTHTRSWYRIDQATNVADGQESSADVYLYSGIGGWFGITAAQFAKEFTALDVDRINLYINSYGGEVYDGVAILNVIRRAKAHVRIQVDGIAASAASFIAMGGDELVMGRNAELMIHDASSIVWGNAEEMTKEAGSLDRISDNIAAVYAERAGGDVSDWRAAMKAETWYSAEEAVAAGLADSIADEASDDAAGATADPAPDVLENPLVSDSIGEDSTWQSAMARFTYRGRADAPAPAMPGGATGGHRGRVEASAARLAHAADDAASHKPPAPPVDDVPREKGAGAMPDIIKALRDRLGIPADAQLDEDGLMQAVDKALTERPTTATTAPEGTVLVDEGTLAELRANAEAGRQARDEQVAAQRVAAVATAVDDGRIPPSRREHWLAQLAADPAAATVLDSLPKDTVPLTARGVTGGVDESSDDQLYTKAWGRPADEKKEG